MSIIIVILSFGITAPSSDFMKEIRRCCQADPSLAIACYHNTSHQRSSKKKVEIGLVTYADENVEYFGDTIAVNEAYCAHHQYAFKFMNTLQNGTGDLDPRWNKVKVLMEALDPAHGWAKDMSYVVWIDADLCFLNFGFSIDDLIASNPQAHFMASAEHSESATVMNSGAIILKNSKWSRKFLKLWWGKERDRLVEDQDRLTHLYVKEMQKVDNKMSKFAVLPTFAINSEPPAWIKQQPNHNVLHLMGEANALRKVVFAKIRQVTIANPDSLNCFI